MTDSTNASVQDDVRPDSIHDNLVRVMHFIEERAALGTYTCGVRTGFQDLDKTTQGFMPGDLVVVAGRPSMGKTTFALNVATFVAAESDKPAPALVITTDHTKDDLTLRLLAARSQIDFKRLRLGRLVDRDWPRLAQAADRLARAHLDITEAGWLSIAKIRHRVEHMTKAGHPPRLVVVDKFYSLTLGEEPEEGSNNRTNEQAQIVVELKALARAYGFTLIVIADINKGMEARPDKRPHLVDMKDGSAALESYADHILLLYRHETYYRDGEDRGLGEVILAKTRSDTFKSFQLAFTSEHCRWADLAPAAKAEPVIAPV